MPKSTHQIYRSATGQTALADLYDWQLVAWPVAYTAQWVETRVGTTHLLAMGDADAPPLILFHGWGMSAASLALHYDVEWLAQYFRLLLPDTPGQPGRSPETPPADYGAWAAALLDALGLNEVFAAGSAGGGTLALKLAAAAPDRVIRAVVVESGGLAAYARSPRLLTALVLLRLRPSVARAQRWVSAVSAAGRSGTIAHAHLARQVALAAQHVAAFTPPTLTDAELTAIRAPILLLYGDQNPLLRSQVIRRAENAILNAEVEPLPGAGHYAGLDVPGMVEERMQAFFASLG